MTDDDILVALDCEYPFPREALTAATERRAALAPRLIADIERCAAMPYAPTNRPNRLVFAIHLLAEWRDKSAYRPLCALLRIPGRAQEAILGDVVTETGPRLLASVFDGDPQPLYDLALDRKVNEYVRGSAFEALAIVTALGELPIADMERFLRESFDRLRPRRDNFAWCGWEEAVSDLGLESLAPLVRRAHDAGIFKEMQWGDYAEFEEAMRLAIEDNSAALKGGSRFRGLFGSTVTELSGWHSFSEEAQRERAADEEVEDEELAAKIAEVRAALQHGRPQINPYRDVGRNDPCPCGSGLKFKRCHGKS